MIHYVVVITFDLSEVDSAMDKLYIDFNCDLGELEDGGLSDRLILPFVTSANIACGYHAGNKESMERTVRAALEFGCNIGAHPGFPDRENFGRTEMELTHREIRQIVRDQIASLGSICDELGATISHVKPHGALYNMAARNYDISLAICEGMIDVYGDDCPIIFGLAGSKTKEAAESLGLLFAGEVFSDRGYMPDGSLVPRTMAGALINDETEIINRVIRMIVNKEVTAIDGSVVPIQADTLCLHGDGEHAVIFAEKISDALNNAGISLVPLNRDQING